MAPDVVVIGGGPAGSTAATMMSRQGVKVLLLERARFPREHIGESLLPASVPVLEELGARPAVEAAGFPPKWGATMVWGRQREPWSWYFRETNSRYPHSWQVSRAEFDQLLLNNSRENGVEVLEGHRVVEVLFEGSRAIGVRHLDPESREVCTPATFIVDASGQTAFLSRALNLRVWDHYFRNMAVYAYFDQAKRLPPPDETNILVESQPDGWMWAIPLKDGVSSVGVVVDRSAGEVRLKQRTLAGFLRDQIEQAPRVRKLVQGSRMVRGPLLARDWSYVSRQVVGQGWILAGDAACFVDPLFSSGVHLALSSGVLAAAYVVTALSDAGLARAAAPVYRDLYSLQYQRFHQMASLFYATNRTQESYFWEARRMLGLPQTIEPREAFIHAVAGQPPQGYERAVLEMGELDPELAEAIHSAETRFRQRRQLVTDAGARLGGMVPALAADAGAQLRPVPGRGRFMWGEVVTSPLRPEGIPVSTLVADLVRRVDGQRTVTELVAELATAYGPDKEAELESVVRAAVSVLYEEGAIESLGRGASAEEV